MEDTVQEAAKILDQTEKDLLISVALKEPTYSGLELQLAKFREAAVNLFFLDLQVATSKDVETRLWGAHTRVNSKFRAYLALLREKVSKKKFVERRKAEELFKTFLKSSTLFYRTFIQRLAANFKDVPEIFNIARGFGQDPLSAHSPSEVSLEQKKALIRSCHLTLIRLGDLSRYRESEIPKNADKRNWGPAVGYYELARALVPDDGQAFNQRAVISLANNDHLRGVYHLYRALTVKDAPEPAKGNLELEFKKIRNRHARHEPLLPADTTSVDPVLEASFLTLHARCYGDHRFHDDDYESECLKVVRGFIQSLKEKPCNSAARKMCLINIAASYYTLSRARESATVDSEGAMRGLEVYRKLQNLNILTFKGLLQLLTEELRQIVTEGVNEMDQASCMARIITPVCRRVLPHLCLYSSWLLTNAEYLLEGQDALNYHNLPQMWESYAYTLNLIMAAFPLQHLPKSLYLLDEDQDTAAFIAFSGTAQERRLQDSGRPKPNRSEAEKTAARRPEMEMLMRVKDLLADGVYYCKHPDKFGSNPVPLVMSERRFHFTGQSTDNASRHPHELAEGSYGSEVVHDATWLTNSTHGHTSNVTRTRTDDLENMVDNLVGPDPMALGISAPLRPPVNGSQSASRPSTGTLRSSDIFGQLQQASPGPMASPALSPGHTVSLPTVWKTPFTPRLGGSNGSSPRPSTANQVNGSLATPSGLGTPSSPSELAFNHDLAQMQQNIQNRSSPMKGFDPTVTPASYYQTPTGFDTFIRKNGSQSNNPSPWLSSAQPVSTFGTELPREVSQASPYGAIGDSRRKSAKTPTSGQFG